MIKHIQSRLKTDTQRGNCLPTVIACIMDIENPEDVIQIQEYYDRNDILWIEKLDEWLLEKGWEYEYVGEHLFNDEYYLVSGNTIRNIKHVCIYKNGKLFHDPHPSQQGLISETSIHTLRKTN